MELFVLNSNRMPGPTVKKFESLQWTERYLDPGDFQLTVADRIAVLNELPRGSLVSHTDTREVMRVEDHEITRDEEKGLKIVITGRSFETFAENRVTEGSYDPLNDPITGDAITQVSPNQSGCKTARDLLRDSLEDGTASADDEIDYLTIVMTMRVEDPDMVVAIQRGNVYSRVVELLGLSDGGLKTIRPIVAGNNMQLVVHDGLDLTDDVVFYALYQDLVDAKYFWSDRAYKNYAAIAAKTYARLYRTRALLSGVTGLNRRVMYVDANDIEGDYSPGTASDVIAARGQTALDDQVRIALIQARISETARPKFKIHYDVGDLVMVFGEFSTAQAMRVTEHILTVDETGQHGYPSLRAL